MKCKLVTITPDAEKHVVYCARVTSENQTNPDIEGLLKFCVKSGHWSIFSQATATFEIESSVAIIAQMLRHTSFDPQQFSRRYSDKNVEFEYVIARKQGKKNRQSSEELCDDATIAYFNTLQEWLYTECLQAYHNALDKGIAREQCRFLLPQGMRSRLYWTGNLRSFIHWINLRTQPDTQAEHRIVAEACKHLLCMEIPTIAKALGWL